MVYCYYKDELVRKIRIDKIIFIEHHKDFINVYYDDSLGLDDIYQVDCTKIVFKNE